jgi:hypothetical protein
VAALGTRWESAQPCRAAHIAQLSSGRSHFAKPDVRQDWRQIGRGGDITTTPLSATAVDIIEDLCDRFRSYNVYALCHALAVPAAECPLFARWATDFLNPVSLGELYAHLDVMIAQRCTRPGDDLLSELIGLDADGDGLTVDDLHTIVATLLAGVEV